MATIYAQASVENLVYVLENSGYISVPLSCEKIGLGSFVMLSPDEFHDIFIIEEIDVSYNCVAYQISKRRKISKSLQKRMEFAQEKCCDFVGYYNYELCQ